MPSLQIRNLPDDVYEALAWRAKKAHRSLAQQALVELRDHLTGTTGVGRRDILEAIKRSRKADTPDLDPPPETLIREDRGR